MLLDFEERRERENGRRKSDDASSWSDGLVSGGDATGDGFKGKRREEDEEGGSGAGKSFQSCVACLPLVCQQHCVVAGGPGESVGSVAAGHAE